MKGFYLLIAVLLAGTVGVSVYAATSVNDTARDRQVESCERVSILRREVNKRGDILHEFLLSEARFRAQDNTAVSDRAARRYAELAADVAPVDVPDCQDVVR